MKPRLISLVFLAFVAILPALAQTSLESVISSIRSVPVVAEKHLTVMTLTPAASTTPRETSEFVRQFSPDGSFQVHGESADSLVQLSLRADGTLVHGFHLDKLKQLSVTEEVDDRRTTLRTIVRDHGKVKSDKTAKLSTNVVLRDEMDYLIPQAWQAGIRDGLTFKSLSPDGGLVGDFQILFRQTTNPCALATQYTVPDEFRQALPAGKPYVVADMCLTGMAALFVPFHFYLVYQAEGKQLRFCAYFGESPQKPTFQYVVEKS